MSTFHDAKNFLLSLDFSFGKVLGLEEIILLNFASNIFTFVYVEALFDADQYSGWKEVSGKKPDLPGSVLPVHLKCRVLDNNIETSSEWRQVGVRAKSLASERKEWAYEVSAARRVVPLEGFVVNLR